MLDAPVMASRGFLHAVVPDADVAREVEQRARRMATLSPQAARLNKQALRALWPAEPPASLLDHAYRYADSPEHREGIAAFNEKRAPVF